MAKKPKAAPMSDTTREYCRDLYRVAVRAHAARVEDATVAVAVLALLRYQYANGTPASKAEDPFDLLVDIAEQALEADARVNVERDVADDLAHHMNLDVLPRYIAPHVDVANGGISYVTLVLEARERGYDGGHELDAFFAAAIVGENKRREQYLPTFEAFAAAEEQKLANMRARGKSDDEPAHIRAASS